LRASDHLSLSAATVATVADSHDTGRMFVALLLGAVTLYLVVRMAVRHGVEDAWRHRSDRQHSGTDSAELTRPSGLSVALHWVLGAFGWL
jgi:hypothetical protein